MNLHRSFFSLLVAVIALIFPVVLVSFSGAASASTISVTTTSDLLSPSCPSASECSFRGAVASASEGDVVSMPAGTYLLTQGEVVTTRDIVIDGAGPASTILDASGLAPSPNSRVLRIAGATTKVTTVRDLSVTGGRVENGSRSGGGGIRCNSRSGIVLANVRIHGNSVTSTDLPADAQWIGGAGLWSIGTVLIRENSLIEDNTVTVAGSLGKSGGGGVMVAGDHSGPNLVVSNSTLQGNSVEVEAAPDLGYANRDGGGGAYVAANDLILRSSSVEDNSATISNSWGDSGGGGVYVSGGNLEVVNSNIGNNRAEIEATADLGFNPNDVSSDGGGGAYVSGLNANFTDSEVSGNEAVATESWGESGGGGVYVSSRATSGEYVGDLNASRSTFSGNSVSATPTASFRLRSHYGGGAIYQDSHDISLDEVTLSDNAVVVNGESEIGEQYSVNGGGAIYQYGNRTSISNSTLSGNSAQLPLASRSGGGALMDNGQSSLITNSTFSGNEVDFDEAATEPDTNGGGAINYTQEPDGVVLANVTIAGNRSEGAAGGAIVPTGGTVVRIGGSIIASNSSTVPGTDECATIAGGEPQGSVTSLGYNLTDDDQDSCGLNGPGDLIADPGIGSLGQNGGPTETRALTASSPAIDAGNPDGCLSAYGEPLVTDQRGFPRPSPAGSRCDIGAVERQVCSPDVQCVPVLAKPLVEGPKSVRREGKSTYRITLRNTGDASMKNLRVKATGRGVNGNRWVGSLAAGASRTIELPLRFLRKGKSRVTFTAITNNAGRKAVKRLVRIR